jgi:L-ascorbate metabolism protein UlaG (beta-lactamase superfamily)
MPLNIVHYGHACVLLETAGARVLFDPGTFSDGFESLDGLDAVLITHHLQDHIDTARLPALLEANPGAELIIAPGTESTVTEAGLPARTAHPGETLRVGGAPITVVGGVHATIHPDIPVVPNIGYIVDDGAFYHPGDAFFVPEQRIDVLGLPTGAPWLKASEAVDFLREIAPRVAVPIHEAVLARPQMHYDLFGNLAPEGTEVNVLPRGERTAV